MRRIRWHSGLLAGWLIFLFNIERLDFDHGSTLNFASFVYVLVGAITILVLVLPLRRRQFSAAVVATLLAYAAIKVSLAPPVIAGVAKYLTAAEIASLLLSAGLSWRVSRSLRDFEEAVEAISLPEGRAQLLPYRKARKRLQAELGRSRRYQRPLSVAALQIDPATLAAAIHRTAQEVQAAMIARYAMLRVGIYISSKIRDTDILAEDGRSGRFLLVAPETTAEQSEALLRRLQEEVRNDLGVDFRHSTADFPTMALTSDELVRSATDLLATSEPWAAIGVAAKQPEVPVA